MALNIQTFKTRALTAIAFVAVMLSGLLINGFLFSLLFLVILVGCLWEFSKINKIINQKNSIKFYFAALFYIVCPIIMMLGLASDFHYMDLIFKAKYYPALPCLIIFSIWINDTMAYLVGSFIGKTPFSSISPKKTWEGTIGGAVLCVATIALYTILFDPNHEFTLKFNITIAFICSVFGTIGDLLESKLKRMANIKDSGSLMPGHGGFLDRFDSLLIAVPAVCLYIVILFLFC